MVKIARMGAGFGVVLVAASLCAADVVLRIATYNITAAGGSPRAGLDTILQGIGNESVGGRVIPVDLIGMQEIQGQATTSQAVVSLLNTIYGAGAYAHGTLNGASTGSGTQGVVYNTTKLELTAANESTIGTASTSGQPRQTMKYKFHPIGAPATADFFVYVGHWKASDSTSDEARRLVEATAIRDDADVPAMATAAIIYMGDFNVYRATDNAFEHMQLAGNGQAFDPLNRVGAWHATASFKDVFSQAPAVSPPGGLTGGGLDDRFDWQMVTGEVMAGTPGVLTYITGSYHTFGNNGSVALNGNINDASNTALPGLPNRTTVLNLLTTVSDHLPVVADYTVVLPGACCSGAGVCNLVLHSACGAGNTWNGGAACSPNTCGPPPPTGACCNTASGGCTLVVQSSCVGGSTWNGGATCSPNPCPQPSGSCCTPTGCCTMDVQASCNGVWTVGGTCTPNICASPTGRCCAANGSCTLTSACACAATWTSGGTCSPNSCPQPTGACCVGSACSMTTQAACAGAGGQWQGSVVACGQPGNPTTCCPANFDSVGGVQVVDIFVYLAAWFAQNGLTGPGHTADFNHDNVVNVNDIFAYLGAWFADCS